MPQIGRYPDNMKVGQLFTMLQNIRNVSIEKTDQILIEQFELEKIFEKPMRTLSGGTRQKVSAAVAFLFDPPILILDEPTAGLDPLASEILKEKILSEKKKNKLILITSHILSDLDEITTHIMYMQEGKMQFFKDIGTLQEETGELRLGKAIARIMKGEKFSNEWIDKMLEIKKDEKNY
jgi:Cu-processing system ATP-binding protein